MSKKRKTLSHEEIWDDSALIDSWNEALSEYQYYHSLHARGEKVEDVLREAEQAESAGTNGPTGTAQADDYVNGHVQVGQGNGDMDDGELAEGGEAASQDRSNAGMESTTTSAQEQHDAKQDVPIMPSLASVPLALVGGAQDAALKNLMMSWYYAGYYTGLYEGQQKAQQPAPKQQEEDAKAKAG